MALSIDNLFGIHDDALQLRARRSEVLSRNLANADTPHYKARDFDFAQALDRATDQAGPAAALTRTNPNHLAITEGASTNAALQYRTPMQPSLDGNTVETDTEKAEFGSNAMRYQASLMMVNRRISSVRSILQGRS